MLRLCKILKFSDFLFSKPVLSRFLSTSEVLRMELKEVVKRLEQFAPTSLGKARKEEILTKAST